MNRSEAVPGQTFLEKKVLCGKKNRMARRCERENTKVGIVKAPIPEPVIKGSAASASAIANIMIQKYAMGVPLYRQESSWLNEGLSLSRQTMSNWLIKSASDWLLPLYEEMRTKMLKEDILHADETTVQVLKEPGRASRTNSYMWLYLSLIHILTSFATDEGCLPIASAIVLKESPLSSPN